MRVRLPSSPRQLTRETLNVDLAYQASVAQRTERGPSKSTVAGSSPVGSTSPRWGNGSPAGFGPAGLCSSHGRGAQCQKPTSGVRSPKRSPTASERNWCVVTFSTKPNTFAIGMTIRLWPHRLHFTTQSVDTGSATGVKRQRCWRKIPYLAARGLVVQPDCKSGALWHGRFDPCRCHHSEVV